MLSDKQIRYLRDSDRSFNFSLGAVSSGKSHVNNLRFFDYIHNDVPDNCLLTIVGKTSDSIYDNVVRELEKISGEEDFHYQKQPQRIYIPSKKIEIPCVSGDNEASWKRSQGKTTAGCYVDEATNIPISLLSNIFKGCRLHGKVWSKFLTMNPDHPSSPIKTNFIDSPNIDSYCETFFLDDNPVLTEEYKNEVKNYYSGFMYDRMILGKWTRAEGVVYEKFNPAVNVVESYNIDAVSEYILGIDWGFKHRLVLLLIAVDHDGRYVVVDEISVTEQLVDEELKKMMENQGWFDLNYSSTLRKPKYAYADAARPDEISKFYKLTGISTFPADKHPGSVSQGITMVHHMMIPQRDGLPRLTILKKCKDLLNGLDRYCWAKGSGGSIKDEPKKEQDDEVDALRYPIYTREKNRPRVIDKNPFR